MDTRADTDRPLGTPRASGDAGLGDGGSNERAAPRARRKFTAAYKLRILTEYEALPRGERGLLLRREGLYSSHVDTWLRQSKQGELAALTPRKRGRKPLPTNPLRQENQRLETKVARLEERLRQAETIIEVQKKLSALLGLPPTGALP